MKLGFLTVGLSPMSLIEIMNWAAQAGFETLEVGCWPLDNTRPFKGTQLDVAALGEAQAADILAESRRHHLPISCLTYCDNNLARDKAKRAANQAHLLKVIDAAAMLKVDTVCTFIGRDESKPIAENIELAGRELRPILDYAAGKNVRVCIENCPMPGWQFEGLVGNVAHTPEIWDRLFEVLPDDNFGLNLDPSHLHWLGIDPARAAREYGSKIFYAHAKDTQIIGEQRYRRGVMDLVEGGWRRSRLPGRGEIDFGLFIKSLRQGGYDGPLSIELEDRDWLGSSMQVQEGLKVSRQYLKPLISALD
ncbi:MAG: sugar phosphate isomerase/epimerase [Anaerolineae bacterium]